MIRSFFLLKTCVYRWKVVNDNWQKLFSRNDHQLINLTINGILIRSKPTINALCVLFNSKLNFLQIAQTVQKAKKATHVIKLIREYVTKIELKQLITSNFYSVLYYNCEIWLLPGLNINLKKHLLSASARALKLCDYVSDIEMSFERLHFLHGRDNPTQMMKYTFAQNIVKQVFFSYTTERSLVVPKLTSLTP